MTGVLEAPPATEEQRDAVPPRRRGFNALRAELRIARRQTTRAWTSSLLVVALVALPISLLTAGAVFAASRLPALDQRVTSELGQSDAWLRVVHGPDPTLFQSAGDAWSWDLQRGSDGEPVTPDAPPIDDPSVLLPAGVDAIELDFGRLDLDTPGGVGTVSATIGEAWHPALEGRFELLEGRAPESAREAMVSPGTLARLNASIGDDITLTGSGASFTIVGVLKTATSPDSLQEVFLSEGTREGSYSSHDRVWLTPEWQPAAEDLPRFNSEGVIVYARDLTTEAQSNLDAGSAWAVAAGVAIAASFVAYLVVLLAGSAFAVSTRRQQRSLAVAASVGAESRSIFRIVLLQGTVLGATGGVVGMATGVGVAAIALAVVDDGSAASYWGFNVPWSLILGIAAFAVGVGTASALAPARAATRGDVLSSLRGARKPVSVRASRPLWGSFLIGAGLVATLAAGSTLAALNTVEMIDYGHPLRTIAVIGIVAGPILFQIGVVLAGHWLLSLFARGASRSGLAARIATRDAAAHPSRVVPAFGAIAACVFLASFALTAVALGSASNTRQWWYSSPIGTVSVSVYSDYDNADEMERRAREALALAAPDRTAVVRSAANMWASDEDGVPIDERAQTVFVPELQHYTPCDEVEFGPCTDPGGVWWSGGSVYVASADDLAVILGVEPDGAARATFRDGGAIVSAPRLVDDGSVTINELDAYEVEHWYENQSEGRDAPIESTATLPAAVVSLPHGLPWTVIVSPETADSLGIPYVVTAVIGDFDTAPSQNQLDELAQSVSQQWSDTGSLSHRYEIGAPDPAPWLWLIVGAAGALVLGAASVVLGLARIERRPDDATLAAVGASRRLRRGIAFWQGIVIVGVGSVTGAIAGVIPMWGIAMQSQGSLTLADTPWAWLLCLALGLPLVIAAANALVPPRHPDLTRRTAIA